MSRGLGDVYKRQTGENFAFIPLLPEDIFVRVADRTPHEEPVAV